MCSAVAWVELKRWKWLGRLTRAFGEAEFSDSPSQYDQSRHYNTHTGNLPLFFILAQQSWTGGTVENYVNATSQSTTPDYTFFFILFSVHSASYREYVVRRIICDVTRHQACLLSGVDFSSRSYTRCLCACTSLEISNENMCSKQNIH